MKRSKYVALTLLLGAVLLGGMLGFTVERVTRDRAKVECAAEMDRATARAQFADEVGLDGAQRVALDSMLERRNARLDSLYDGIRPQTRAAHDSARAEFRRLLTPDQMARYEAMRARDDSGRGRTGGRN